MIRTCFPTLVFYALIGLGHSSLALAQKTEESVVRITFVGDVMLDNGPGHVVSSGKDPFEACKELFQGTDFSIANLECVLGRGGEQMNKNYTFRGATDSPRHLKNYFNALSLANNHTLDFGTEGLVEMLSVLDKHQIPHFGAGKNIVESRKPLVFERKGMRFAVLGYNEFNSEYYAATKDTPGNSPMVEAFIMEDIKRARETLKCDHVVLFLHWGEELWNEPRPDQRAMARKWIDMGASAVIGAHPHITQTIEYHRGKPIIYSLGNFAFDYYPVDPPEWTGWVATLEFGADHSVNLQIRSVIMDASGCPKIAPTETAK